MKAPGSLRHRIILSSFAMASVICFLFSVGLFGSLEFAEWVLFDKHIESDIRTFIGQYERNPEIALLPRENFEAYVAVGDDTSKLPPYLRNLPDDADEVVTNDREFHLDVRRSGNATFYFLFDETEFEEFDKLVAVFVPGMIVFITALAVILGLVFSNRIVRPVTELARQVNSYESDAVPVEPDRSRDKDEIEILAAAISGFQARVQELLTREREFSTDVSHELRTPLMGIQAAADNLLTGSATQSRIEELSHRIQARCRQMRALVDAMLALARDPHSLENDFRSVKLADRVRDQIEAAEPHLAGKGITIRKLGDADPAVFTSEAILDVVIGNILRNAVLHSNSREIHVRLTPRGLSVTDFGEGIPGEVRERIFERRASNSGNHARDLGIGLSLVQRLCRHFNWALAIESVQGRGTTFSVDFGDSIRS